MPFPDPTLIETNRQPAGKDDSPEWMGPGGISRKFGLSRSSVYDLIKRGHIRSASLKEPHQRHGKRLVHVGSVRAFLESRVEVVPSPVPHPPLAGPVETGF